MIPVLDPFMTSVPATGIQRGRGGFYRSKDGAPYVSDPTGELCKTGARKGEAKRLKYGSPSSAGTLIENDVGLTKHKQRKTFLGIGMSEELREACRDLALMEYGTEEFNTAADTIVVKADTLTRSWLAADRGTHGHLICEMVDQAKDWASIDDMIAKGEAVDLDKVTQLAVASAWARLLDWNDLEILAVESSCVDDAWRLAGTLDRLVRTTKPLTFVKPGGELVVVPADIVIVLDLKFGKCRKAHPIQIASYAQSQPYDTETEQRGEWPWPIDQTHALIAHGDFGDNTRPPSIELVWVDLVAGREHGGQCVVDAKAWAARDDVFSVAQIVEGADSSPNGRSSAPSTLSPVPLAPVAGEVEAASAFGVPPSPALSEQEYARSYDCGWYNPDPARLALVDARAALCPNPDEGADWSSDEFAPLWDELRGLFDGLDVVVKSWRSQLVGQGQRRHVEWHAQGGRTERRYYINKAVIALALAGEGDDILRELLSHIIGDVALMLGCEPGHCLGSLGASEAKRFAEHVDAYLSVPMGAA